MRVGLIGYGYWGQKLARVLDQLGVLAAICDTDPARLQAAREAYPLGVGLWGLPELLFNPPGDLVRPASLDRVVIATPPETHYALAAEALARGLGVFVEKPLATTYKEAKQLENLAREKGLPLMVGHIYLHCPGIQLMERPAGQADLYIKLLNPQGPPSPSGQDIAWAALPHAASLALYFFPCWPEDIEAHRDGERLRAILGYWDGSRVFIDVGNHTGEKARAVELRVGNTRFCYENGHPQTVSVCSGVEKNFYTGERMEPLTLEMTAFLEARGVGPLGAQVVKLVEHIVNARKPARG